MMPLRDEAVYKTKLRQAHAPEAASPLVRELVFLTECKGHSPAKPEGTDSRELERAGTTQYLSHYCTRGTLGSSTWLARASPWPSLGKTHQHILDKAENKPEGSLVSLE